MPRASSYAALPMLCLLLFGACDPMAGAFDGPCPAHSIWAVAASSQTAWVTQGCADNRVWRVDRAATSISRTYDPGGDAYHVAVGSGAAWVIVKGGLLRIDEATNRTLVVRQDGSVGAHDDIAVIRGTVWLTGQSQRLLFQLDSVDGHVLRSVPLSGLDEDPWWSFATGEDDSLWLYDRGSGASDRLLRVDVGTGNVDATGVTRDHYSMGPNTRAIAFVDHALWMAGNAREVRRVDPATGIVIAKIPIPADGPMQDTGYLTGIASNGARVWVSDARSVYQIDPSTNEVRMIARAPTDVSANGKSGPINEDDLVVTDSAIWVTIGIFSTESELLRFDASTGKLTARIHR